MRNNATINYEPLKEGNLLNIKTPIFNQLTDWLPRPLNAIVAIPLILFSFVALFVILCITLVVLSTALFTLLTHVFHNQGVTIAVMAVIWCGSIWLLSIWAGRRNTRSRRSRSNAIQKFARSNGWKYGRAGKLVRDFANGTQTKSADENGAHLYSLQGSYLSHDFELLMAWRSGGWLEPLQPQLFVKSRKPLPDATLVSRDMTDGGKLADKLFVHVSNPVPVSLEGDFDEYFQLYVPKDSQVDALSLIAPDFMETAKTFVDKFTIQMSGSAFALLSRQEEVSAEVISDLFTAAEQLLTETDY